MVQTIALMSRTLRTFRRSLQTVIGFTEQCPVESECRPALKVSRASLDRTLASLQVSRAKQKVSRASRERTGDAHQVSWSRQKVWGVSLEARRVSPKVSWASLEGTFASLRVSRAKQKVSRASREGASASLQVSRSRQKVWRLSLDAKRVSSKVSRAKQKVSRASLNGKRATQKVSRLTLQVRPSTLFASHSTLWGSMEGDGAAMKPDFAGFMAVEQSRLMPCSCRVRVLERTAPVREVRPAVVRSIRIVVSSFTPSQQSAAKVRAKRSIQISSRVARARRLAMRASATDQLNGCYGSAQHCNREQENANVFERIRLEPADNLRAIVVGE